MNGPLIKALPTESVVFSGSESSNCKYKLLFFFDKKTDKHYKSNKLSKLSGGGILMIFKKINSSMMKNFKFHSVDSLLMVYRNIIDFYAFNHVLYFW